MQHTIILIITCLILLLLLRSLSKLFFRDSKSLCYFFFKPFVKVNHYNKSDYNRAFKYLLTRKTINTVEQREERLFFLSLINEATSINQLKTFTEQIKRFYRKKVKLISSRQFKAHKAAYTQQYKEIVIFLIMAISNRFEIIKEFAAINDYHAFVKLIVETNDPAALDAILIFAEKLKLADYKKIKQLADQKKAIIKPQSTFNKEIARQFSVIRLITHIMSSSIKYLILGYLLIVFSSLALSLSIPMLVTEKDNPLLALAHTLKKQTFIPYFAQFNSPYFINNENKVQFYKQADFLQRQKIYYIAKLTNTLCKTATFKLVCRRNR